MDNAVRTDEVCAVRWPSQLHRRRRRAPHHTDYSVTPRYVSGLFIPFCFIQYPSIFHFCYEYKDNLLLELTVPPNQTDDLLLEGLLSPFHRKTPPPQISNRFRSGLMQDRFSLIPSETPPASPRSLELSRSGCQHQLGAL